MANTNINTNEIAKTTHLYESLFLIDIVLFLKTNIAIGLYLNDIIY